MNIPRAQIWPTVTFNTCTPDGMAAAEAWTRELIDPPSRRGDPDAVDECMYAWTVGSHTHECVVAAADHEFYPNDHECECGAEIYVEDTPQAPSRPETPTDGTGIPPKPETGTQDVVADFVMFVDAPPKPTDKVVNRKDGVLFVLDGWRYRPARPMPPPKPGTHESDLCDDGVVCCQLCAWNRSYIPALTHSELTEYNAAIYWSRIANRTTERTT